MLPLHIINSLIFYLMLLLWNINGTEVLTIGTIAAGAFSFGMAQYKILYDVKNLRKMVCLISKKIKLELLDQDCE